MPTFTAIGSGLKQLESKFWLAFSLFFAITLALYFPTYRAGWMRDTVGWLGFIRENTFWNYLNIPHHGGSNYYQLTQLVTWIFYQAFGTNRFAWFLVHTSAFALTVTLLYQIVRQLLRDTGVANANVIACTGGLLFCTSPYVTEPVVWKAAWHYLQALLLIMLILHLLLRYLHSGKAWIAVTGIVLYLLSTASLELFYLTPLYASCLLFYYQVALRWNKATLLRTWRWVGGPLWAVLAFHIIRMGSGIKNMASHATGELGTSVIEHYAIMPPLYVLRLLWGRFLPESWQWAYHKAMCNYLLAGLFYVVLLATYAYIVVRIKRFSARGKALALMAVLLGVSMLLVLPTWYPELELIVCDRYAYILLPPFYALIAVTLLRTRAGNWVVALLLVLNVSLTVYLNSLWRRSTDIIEALQTAHPPIDTSRTTILLNNPASLRGAPMFGADISEEWRSMHNRLYNGNIRRHMPEVAAYNMHSTKDGAHILVLDDTTLTVTLNQPGYWTYGFGFDTAAHHSSPYYTMERKSQLSYWLRLHGNPQQYVLWYHVGDRYKVVDGTKHGVTQR